MTEPWYADGLRFECTQCGDCCRTHDGYAYVYLTDEDIQRLASFFDLTRRQFLFKHTEKQEFARVLKWPSDACVFLGEKGCTVYEARPMQCRTWPFWPETLEKKIWDEEVVPFCPGVGKGRRYSLTEIETLASGEWETTKEAGPSS